MGGEGFGWKEMKVTSNPNRHVGEAGRRNPFPGSWTEHPGEAIQRQSRQSPSLEGAGARRMVQPEGRKERGLICFHRRFHGNPYLYGITSHRLAHRETGRLTWLQRAVRHSPSMHWSSIRGFSPLEFLFVSFSCILVELFVLFELLDSKFLIDDKY